MRGRSSVVCRWSVGRQYMHTYTLISRARSKKFRRQARHVKSFWYNTRTARTDRSTDITNGHRRLQQLTAYRHMNFHLKVNKAGHGSRAKIAYIRCDDDVTRVCRQHTTAGTAALSVVVASSFCFSLRLEGEVGHWNGCLTLPTDSSWMLTKQNWAVCSGLI